MLFTTLILALGFTASVLSHPVDDSPETAEYIRREIRSLESCQDQLLGNHDLHMAKMARRDSWINAELASRGIKRRSAPFTKRSDNIFERAVDCVLAPEVTIGPYYLDRMPIRKDNRESQPGVLLMLEMQFVNTRNCQVLPNAYIDMWHANSTGKYSGFAQEGTVGETQLRGLQPTDANGIANFTTIWPGHYVGRAVHTHILVHTGGSVVNGYYQGGQRPHIGQVFYDQALISRVTATSPYSTNRNALLTNTQDSIFRQQNTGYNAIAHSELLGAAVTDGILATITVGVRV